MVHVSGAAECFITVSRILQIKATSEGARNLYIKSHQAFIDTLRAAPPKGRLARRVEWRMTCEPQCYRTTGGPVENPPRVGRAVVPMA